MSFPKNTLCRGRFIVGGGVLRDFSVNFSKKASHCIVRGAIMAALELL
jgi:hypothetical protein